jgi:hypothetical protein
MSSDDALESTIGQPHASCEVREALEGHRGLAWLYSAFFGDKLSAQGAMSIRSYCEASHMIFEVTFWIAFILASRAIAKIYYRRRDVLFGPYRATTCFRRPRTGVIKRHSCACSLCRSPARLAPGEVKGSRMASSPLDIRRRGRRSPRLHELDLKRILCRDQAKGGKWQRFRRLASVWPDFSIPPC